MRTASLFNNCITSSALYFSRWLTVRNTVDLFYTSDLAKKIYSRVWESVFEKFGILCLLRWYINLLWSFLYCFETLNWAAWVQAYPSLLEHFVEVLVRDLWVLGFAAPSGSGCLFSAYGEVVEPAPPQEGNTLWQSYGCEVWNPN